MAYATARHILVNSEDECNALKAEIENGASFESVAQAHSQCPSGAQGGDLGQFGPGQMVPEFDKAVFSGDVGVLYGPIQTQFGFHLLEVTSRG
nr:peptidylprolyl isomerase [uncultured Sulfurimonas sp.]